MFPHNCQYSYLLDLPITSVLSPDVTSRLHYLGLRTLRDLVALPGGSIGPRFGVETARLHDALRDLTSADGTQWTAVYRAHPVLTSLLTIEKDASESWRWIDRHIDDVPTTEEQLRTLVEPLVPRLAKDLRLHWQAAVEVGLRLVGMRDSSVVTSRPHAPPTSPVLLLVVVLRLIDQLINQQRVPADLITLSVGIRAGALAPPRQLRLFSAGSQASQSAEALQNLIQTLILRFGPHILAPEDVSLRRRRRWSVQVEARQTVTGLLPAHLYWHRQWQRVSVLNRWRWQSDGWRGDQYALDLEYFLVLTSNDDPVFLVYNHRCERWSRAKGPWLPGFYDARLH